MKIMSIDIPINSYKKAHSLLDMYITRIVEGGWGKGVNSQGPGYFEDP